MAIGWDKGAVSAGLLSLADSAACCHQKDLNPKCALQYKKEKKEAKAATQNL